jgi:hypothetical protein
MSILGGRAQTRAALRKGLAKTFRTQAYGRWHGQQRAKEKKSAERSVV